MGIEETPQGFVEGQQVVPPQDLGEQPQTTAESARVTAQDVERTQAEKQAEFSGLMDDMEASAATQGDYFLRVGDKIPLTETQQETRSKFLGMGRKTEEKQVEVGFSDQRVLILKAPESTSELDPQRRAINHSEYTLVTRDGIKILRFVSNSEDRSSRDYRTSAALSYIKEGRQVAPGSGFIQGVDSSRITQATIQIGYVPDAKKYDEGKSPVMERYSVPLYDSAHSEIRGFDGTPQEFQERVKKSIDMTESPHKTAVEKASGEKQLATSARQMLKGLPPRS